MIFPTFASGYEKNHFGSHGIIGFALIAIAAANTLKRHKFLTRS